MLHNEGMQCWYMQGGTRQYRETYSANPYAIDYYISNEATELYHPDEVDPVSLSKEQTEAALQDWGPMSSRIMNSVQEGKVAMLFIKRTPKRCDGFMVYIWKKTALSIPQKDWESAIAGRAKPHIAARFPMMDRRPQDWVSEVGEHGFSDHTWFILSRYMEPIDSIYRRD